MRICLLFDEMYLQKCEEYFGGELIGSDENGELYKEIVCFMMVRLKESIPCDQVISRNNKAQKQSSGGVLKKRFLRNFAKFTGKHLCESLFFNKVAGLMHATLLKKRLWHRCFPVNFVEFLRTPFFAEHLRWLLLNAA